jgi:SGNH hydrolase-like domain, acetyltransferase AlgX
MAAVDQIHIGKEGVLFLLQGSNDVSAQFVRSADAQTFLLHWQTVILHRRQRLRDLGIAYRHVLVPEKITIYDNLLDQIEINWKLSPAFRLYHEDQYFKHSPFLHLRVDRFLQRRARWRSTLIDLIGPLRRQRGEQDLYYRTDSHLSFAGRMVAYRAICRAVEASPVRDFWERPTTYHPGWAGDLGIAFTPPRYEGTTLHHIQRDAVRVYASPIVELREKLGLEGTLHTGAHVVYRNERAADPRRVVLFGDSYANCLPNGLTIMLAETFRELHFIWSTQLDFGYIARVRPDLVLTEMSERFVFRSADDGWSLDRYARQRYGAELAAASTPDAPGS